MTVADLRERMPNVEYHQWRAFHEWRRGVIELENQKAKARRGNR